MQTWDFHKNPEPDLMTGRWYTNNDTTKQMIHRHIATRVAVADCPSAGFVGDRPVLVPETCPDGLG